MTILSIIVTIMAAALLAGSLNIRKLNARVSELENTPDKAAAARHAHQDEVLGGTKSQA